MVDRNSTARCENDAPFFAMNKYDFRSKCVVFGCQRRGFARELIVRDDCVSEWCEHLCLFRMWYEHRGVNDAPFFVRWVYDFRSLRVVLECQRRRFGRELIVKDDRASMWHLRVKRHVAPVPNSPN